MSYTACMSEGSTLRSRFIASGFVAIIVVLVLSVCFFFFRLDKLPLQDYDEATYAEVVAESFQTHDFLSFHFLGLDYFRKPPLLFWLMGADNLVIHEVEFADRLPSALAGVLAVAAVMLLVFVATGDGYAAAFGGGILLAVSAFVESTRQVRFDTLVTLFDLLAIYTFYKALQNRKWFLLYGACIGLAIMSKGPLVLYALVPSLVIAATLNEWRWLKDPYFWGGVGIAVLIVFPWHIYETLKFGMAFWDQYLGEQVYSRVTESLFAVPTTNATYLQYLFILAAPATLPLCISILLLPYLYWKFTREERALYFAALSACVTILLVCILTQTKATTYLIPLYPFEAVAVGIAGWRIVQVANIRLKYILVALGVLLIVVGMYSTVSFSLYQTVFNNVDVELTSEEKNIGSYLHLVHAPTFYVYNTTTLGTIMFYSGIKQPIWIVDRQVLPPGTYLLYHTAEAQHLQGAYPKMKLKPVVYGPSLTLGVVAS